MRRACTTALALCAALAALRPGTAQDSCSECHPAATRGLRLSSHQDLGGRPDACTACHVDVKAHLDSAAAAVKEPRLSVAPPPRVAAASCVACHGSKHSDPALALHAWTQEAARAQEVARAQRVAESRPQTATRPEAVVAPPPAADLEREQPRGLDLTAPKTWLGLDWSALAAFGYRFVDVDGSQARYDTDVLLADGWRLFEFELGAERRTKDAPFDRLLVRAEDIADPWQHVRGELERKDAVSGSADWRKSRYAYHASGDFHHVDTKSDDLALALTVPLSDELEVFAGYRRILSDSFWLTDRVGDRNVTPVGAISGVQSPRELDASEASAGVSGQALGFGFSASVEWYDEDARNRWTYDQPSQINPAFPESESFLSHTSLRGPGSTLSLSRKWDGFHFGWKTRWLSRDRRVVGDGEQQGYDIGEFTTTTTSAATGSAETWLSDLTAGCDLTDDLTLDLDLRWRDHHEEMSIDQTDVTVYPGLGTVTTVTTQLNPHTSQRVLDGSAVLSWQIAKPLSVWGGYGFSRESLSVPDLEAGDNDFVKGTIRTDGALMGARLRPTKELFFEVASRLFDMGGAQLHELTQDEQRSLGAKVRWTSETWRAETSWKTTRASNDISEYRNDSTTYTLSAGKTIGEDFDLDLAWVYADLNSRVLTNFYFDPDPNPVPTFVGFKGDTHTLTGGLSWRPCTRLCGTAGAYYTTTSGSFDVDTWEGRIDVRYELLTGGEFGVQYRQLDYSEAGGLDNYDAQILMVYWRQAIGRAR